MKLKMMAAALVAAFAAAGAAQASVTLDLTVNGCSSGCFANGVTSLGTVTVDAVGGKLDFTVDLLNGAMFNNKSQTQHHAFVFDLDKSGLKIGALPSGFTKATNVSDSPFGSWPYAINYKGPGQGATATTLSFTVSDAANDLTTNDLIVGDIYKGVKLYAAADVYANGTTGNVGATLSQVTGGVPEPATWAMLVLGVGMIGWAQRRRAGALAAA